MDAKSPKAVLIPLHSKWSALMSLVTLSARSSVYSGRGHAIGATAGLIALLTVLVLGVATPADSAESLNSSFAPPAQEIELDRLLAASEFDELVMVRSSDGHRMLKGWVANAHGLARLRAALQHQPVRLSVNNVEEQIRFAREILAGPNRQVELEYMTGGRFLVRARSPDEAALRAAVLRWQALAPAVRDVSIEHTSIAGPPALPAAATAHASPGRSVIAGVDAVCAFGRARYLTIGSHYIFEGATLKGGLIVRSIAEPQAELDHIAATAANTRSSGAKP